MLISSRPAASTNGVRAGSVRVGRSGPEKNSTGSGTTCSTTVRPRTSPKSPDIRRTLAQHQHRHVQRSPGFGVVEVQAQHPLQRRAGRTAWGDMYSAQCIRLVAASLQKTVNRSGIASPCRRAVGQLDPASSVSARSAPWVGPGNESAHAIACRPPGERACPRWGPRRPDIATSATIPSLPPAHGVDQPARLGPTPMRQSPTPSTRDSAPDLRVHTTVSTASSEPAAAVVPCGSQHQIDLTVVAAGGGGRC